MMLSFSWVWFSVFNVKSTPAKLFTINRSLFFKTARVFLCAVEIQIKAMQKAPTMIDRIIAYVMAPALSIGGFYRSEEHSLNSSHVRISYAVFCLKKKKI